MSLDTFTLTQTPTSANLYLYPAGAVDSQCTPVGAATNYQAVNEHIGLHDDDTTYVYRNGTSVVTDMYMVDNHTTQTGTINYVKVCTRVKSHLYSQSPTGVYKVKVTLSSVSAWSSEINPVTDYTTYSYQFDSTPSGSVWNWWDIDNMEMGFEVSSPLVNYTTVNLPLRPDATGKSAQFNGKADWGDGPNNWEYVDDIVANNETNYVYSMTASVVTDLYNIENTTATGTINSVTVAYRYTDYALGGYPGEYIRSAIYPSTVTYYGTSHDPNAGWVDTSDTWTSCPSSGNPWRFGNDIGYLQIGINGKYCACTQVYALVNYNLVTNPEMRTTQMYAIVNYTPGSSTCSLAMPSEYTLRQSRVVPEVDLESGKQVYDLQRDSMSLEMSGVESDILGGDAEARLSCVKSMKDTGVYVTLSGFSDENINTDWLITSFSYSRSADSPNSFDYTISLESYL